MTFAKPAVRQLLAALLLVPALLATAGSESSADERPNILVILSDDVGYSDIGCQGGEIDTPHLNRLADGGIRFTQFYNTGRCCPTRASLLTGLYPHQAGMGWMVNYTGPEAYAGELNRHCVTFAEVLGRAGYSTYMVGKWHVTPAPTEEQASDNTINKENWPLQRGFDKFYGTIAGSGSYFDPAALAEDNELIPPDDPQGFYYTDAISNHAAQFIRQHDRQKPFLMYLAYTAAHWPLHAKQADIAKYKGRYDEGWDKLREERLAKLKKLGLLADEVQLAPNVRDWSDEDRKEWQASRMEVYAAMIDAMDQGIGRVLDSLRTTGQYDNTLVLYLQDNGACQEESRSQQARQRREKVKPVEPMAADALQFASVPEHTRSGQPTQWGREVVPGPANTYMEVGREWANASNTPFRLFKHYVHEGGIATPLIAHWPNGIRRRGELETQPGHLIDIMPTLVELAGAEYPETFHEGDAKIQPAEGVSLVPALAGEPIDRKVPLFWEHEGNRAVRDGDWKLVARGKMGTWQLYNLSKDRSELEDLSRDHPERVSELSGAWEAWAARVGAVPLTPYWPDETEENEQADKQGAAHLDDRRRR